MKVWLLPAVPYVVLAGVAGVVLLVAYNKRAQLAGAAGVVADAVNPVNRDNVFNTAFNNATYGHDSGVSLGTKLYDFFHGTPEVMDNVTRLPTPFDWSWGPYGDLRASDGGASSGW